MLSKQSSLSDFTIGKKFKVVNGDGKPFKGLLGTHDIVTAIHNESGEVEGHKFSAHYSLCRLVQEQPIQLKNHFHASSECNHN